MTLALQLQDHRLTLAEITYRLPDFPRLLQQFVWQGLDIAPKFPVLSGFLGFWETNLEGRIHSVRVATVGLIQPTRVRFVHHSFHIH